jgi:phosphohistidine swiveling domain-containing protein
VQGLAFDPSEPWDNLHGPSPADVHWSTDNVGEAVPGVACPLGASIWAVVGERTTRTSFVEIGAFPRREGAVPERLEDRVVRIFCGRVALQVELMTLLGDRLPGTSGRDVAESIIGTVPEDIDYRPTMRRYPVIAWRLPATFLRIPGRLRVEPPRFQAWWQRSLQELAGADLARARLMLSEALMQFEAALQLQTTAVIANSQIMHEALAKLIARAGVGDAGSLSGSGGAEMAVISDIWRASRGELSVDQVLRSHGFHGPLEGEVSSVVWREDPMPLQRMIDEYARLDDGADPRLREARARAELPERQRELLAALPRGRRAGARLILNLAASRIPLRGVAKRSFLQGLDVIRASARRIGAELVTSGVLGEPDDAFYLTADELTGTPPADVAELVAKRRRRREEYRQVSIPGAWKGLVVPVALLDTNGRAERVRLVHGIGVSGGIVEGVVRVVTDPAFTEVEPGEILVAPTTDPSWASIMFLSSGLVVDIGGPISHAAVVARELGLPCVVNTRTGTQQLRTGDRVRVDGGAGTIEVLSAG